MLNRSSLAFVSSSSNRAFWANSTKITNKLLSTTSIATTTLFSASRPSSSTTSSTTTSTPTATTTTTTTAPPLESLRNAAALAADLPPRFMKWSDFDALCVKHAIPKTESRSTAARLAKCGAVVVSEDGVHGHAPQAIRDACEALNEPWNPVAELESTAEALKKELATLRPGYEAQLSKSVSARRSTWSGAFAFTGIQLAVFARLTYFDLDWDTMEPVSYFLGSGVGVLALFFMLFRGFDFSNRGLDREVIRQKYVSHPDVVKYFEVQEKLEKVEKEIEAVMVWVRTGKEI